MVGDALDATKSIVKYAHQNLGLWLKGQPVPIVEWQCENKVIQIVALEHGEKEIFKQTGRYR